MKQKNGIALTKTKRYQARFYFTFEGKREIKQKTFDTRLSAERWLEKQTGEGYAPRSIGHAAQLKRRRWQEQMQKSNYKESDRLLTEIEVFFGARTLVASIDDDAVHNFIVALRSQRSKNPPFNQLTNKSQHHRITMLASLLNLAKRKGWISTTPEINFKRDFGRRELEISIDDFIRAIEMLPADLRCMMLLGLHTGQRLGDLRYSMWNQCDNDVYRYHSTKTKKGGLRIPIRGRLKSELDFLPRRSEYIFPGRRGEVHSSQTVRRELAAACGKAGVKVFTPHHVRHLAATFALESGVDASAVQSWIGWLDPKMLDRYGHPDQRVHVITEKMDEALGQRAPSISTGNVVSFQTRRKIMTFEGSHENSKNKCCNCEV